MSNLKPKKVAELLLIKQPDQFREAALFFLNQRPPAAWCKKHPTASGVQYLPIEKVEFMLTTFFKEWWVEVKQVQTTYNAITVTVTLHYMWFDGSWRRSDGVGAKGLQMDKGAKADDLGAMKLYAVELAAPAAKTYALKNAAREIGSIFNPISTEKYTEYQPVAPLSLTDKILSND